MRTSIPEAINPPATIGILGGGQLGRMVGAAARALGYGVEVLDPDPHCPAAAVSDRVEVGGYDDVGAALRLARRCAVVTVELEHIGPDVIAALEDETRRGLPFRPGPAAIRVTQDRLAERRFLEGIGVPVAPWREVRTRAELSEMLDELAGDGSATRATGPSAIRSDSGYRLKAALGGYDGRSQVRIGPSADPGELDAAFDALQGSAEANGLLLEREVSFTAEISVVVGRGADGSIRAYPPARNRHDDGILVESVIPAPVPSAVGERARILAERIAIGLELVGVMTAELFLLADGSLVVNELAPRVHNSGHATLEAAVTSQFEQHVRAICGLPLGSSDLHGPAAMLNLLGSGPRRPAELVGAVDALGDPLVHLHLYGKREVFDRRKMGHLTALGVTVDEALERARRAGALLSWGAKGTAADG